MRPCPRGDRPPRSPSPCPAQSACSGDTASDGYHIYSYLVQAGTNLSSVTFEGAPSVGYGLVNTSGTYYGAVNTALGTGQINGIPGNFEWGALVSADGLPVSSLLYTGGTTGVWEAGIACANSSGDFSDNWNTEVTFSASSSDPNKFVWSAVPGRSGGLPEITSATDIGFANGLSNSFTPTATGSPTPTITESGTLPTGVTFTGGVLSGTPDVTGTLPSTYPIIFTASNTAGTAATQNFNLTVGTAAAVSSASSTTFTEGTSGSFQVTGSGTPSPLLSQSGTLPSGISFDATTGILAGTAKVSGVFTFKFTATNGIGTPGSQTFTLTIDAVPVITSADSYSFIKGSSPNFTVTASGYPAPTFSDPGPLDGLSINATTGALTGTPTTTGSFASTITASNGVGTAPTQSFTLTVNSAGVAPTITSADATSFSQGAAGSFTVTATGTPAPTFTETGPLPSGVSLSTAGLLSGTPAYGTAGSYPITITASNGVGSPGTQSFILTVLGFHISTTTLPDGVAGQAYSQQLSTQGGNPALGTVTWKKVSLPKGLALSSTGLLSGVPSIKAVGPTAGVDVSATLGHKGQVVTATIPFTINAAPTFGKKPVVAAAFTEGTPGSVTIAATGSPTPTIAEMGTLPSGVTFNNGVISGTPAVTVNSAVYSLTITASNGIAPAATETFTLTVYAPLAVTSPTSLSPATHGQPYGPVTFTATGANGIYAWKKVSVPKGLAISSGGVLSGTPKSAGSDTVTVEVESKDGKVKVSKDYSLHLTVS